MPKKTSLAMAMLAVALSNSIATALAGEGAGSNITLGATTFQTPVIPDPGFYYSTYLNYYSGNRFNDGNGDNIVPNYDVDAWVSYNQFLYVTPLQFGEIKYSLGAVIPVASIKQDAGGELSSSAGLADIIFQPVILSWKKGNFHALMLQGFIAPTGVYDEDSDINVGRNTWQYQPQLSLGYIDPEGFEITATATYIVSSTNHKPMAFFANPLGSDYRSGQELGIDFAIGYNFTPQFELGLTGYYYKQLTDDKASDPVANAILQENFDGFRGTTYALGIGARYLTEFGEFHAQAYKELEAKNRPQGTSAWLRWSIKF